MDDVIAKLLAYNVPNRELAIYRDNDGIWIAEYVNIDMTQDIWDSHGIYYGTGKSLDAVLVQLLGNLEQALRDDTY